MEEGKKALSIKDVAAISGVSIATVSRVLNKKGRYSPETEKKVLAVVNSYGYVSNQTAKSLREAKSHTIGLIVPNVNNSFFSNLAYYIETYLFEQGYSLFICNSANTAQKEVEYFRTLSGKGVDGILCISSLDKLPDEITARQIPIVRIDRRPHTAASLPWVGNDDFLAMYTATEYLLNKGCRHILFISSYLGLYNQRLRYKGYEQALKDRNIFVDKNYILERPGTDPTQVEVEILVYEFLQNHLPIDGIIATSDLSALGAMYAVHRAGRSIPKDIKIVGIDNTFFSLLTTPSLSSIERNPQMIAHESCNLLIRLIKGDIVDQTSVLVPVNLIERDSSR